MHNPALVLAVGALLGLVMGMLGGGGGILAVPLLVALGLAIKEASTASLVVVGIGAVAGLVPHHRARRVEWRLGLIFGGLGVGGALIGAHFALHVKPSVIEIAFPLLLVAAAASMLRTAYRTYPSHLAVAGANALDQSGPSGVTSWPQTIVLATGVGLITGFFGVGGGFIVVPALVAAMRLPVRRATATGLLVIAVNSIAALSIRHSVAPPWSLTLTMAAATAAFTVVGALVSRRLAGWVLALLFGSLTLLVAGYEAVRAVSHLTH